MMFFLIFQNIVVGTPVCQYATAEFRCWYTGGPIRGERVKHSIVNVRFFPSYIKKSGLLFLEGQGRKSGSLI